MSYRNSADVLLVFRIHVGLRVLRSFVEWGPDTERPSVCEIHVTVPASAFTPVLVVGSLGSLQAPRQSRAPCCGQGLRFDLQTLEQ